ncbi:DUF4194 domain-containing protein [Aeromicrobium sp. UC242_57]|uniref:DUF4194 domain-containing protein n=1 Tax=Aeromicrobium sp. UC242_57 TaxID=3374624 RepID=UPI00379AB127
MAEIEVSVALAHLLGGTVYAEDHPAVWTTVSTKTAHLRDHLAPFGLRLLVDDVENYAYLRTLDELPEGMPRLFRRHKLTFGADRPAHPAAPAPHQRRVRRRRFSCRSHHFRDGRMADALPS